MVVVAGCQGASSSGNSGAGGAGGAGGTGGGSWAGWAGSGGNGATVVSTTGPAGLRRDGPPRPRERRLGAPPAAGIAAGARGGALGVARGPAAGAGPALGGLARPRPPREPRRRDLGRSPAPPPAGAPPASGARKPRLFWQSTTCPNDGPERTTLIIHVARQDRLSPKCTNSPPPVKLRLAGSVCPSILESLR